MKKYKLTDETIKVNDHTLHRIECVTAFSDVAAGEKGGWIESEKNLSQSGNAWVFGDARVYGDAQVYGNAQVYDNACVYGDTRVYGNAWVYGNAQVYGDAIVKRDNDYIVFKNFWSSGRYFTWTRSNNMWKVGCFYGTGQQLIEKARKDSPRSGREYERVVRYVESLLADEKGE